MNALGKPCLYSGAGHSTKILRTENGQKVATDIDEKWFVIFEHTITVSTTFLLVMLVYPNLKTIFLVLLLFSYFFFCCRYLLLNRLTHCIQSLSD